MSMRSHYCGLVTEALIGQTVSLCGWVNRRRDHGGVIFVDLRDREGLLQVVFDPDQQAMFAEAEKLRNEFVVRVTGTGGIVLLRNAVGIARVGGRLVGRYWYNPAFGGR